MRRVLFGTFCCIFFAGLAHAQTSGIRGKVIDQETKEALPFSSVYINQTTLGTYTDANGEFVLPLAPGPYELVVSFVGYTPHQTFVNVTEDKFQYLRVSLTAAVLKEVEVNTTKDTEWPKQLARFTKLFLGTGRQASQTKILNPWHLEFTEGKNGILSASCPVPLQIENLNLGYMLTYDLRNFAVSPRQYVIAGYVRYTEIETMDSLLIKRWKKNRDAVYKGSVRHLLASLVAGKAKDEDFNLFLDNSKATDTRNASFMGNVDWLVNVFKTDSIVKPANTPGWYIVKLPPRLEIHYAHKATVAKVYRDIPYPVSWMEVKGGSLEVNADGIVSNPSKLTVLGEMGNARVAQTLPADYKPEKTTEHYRKILPKTAGRLAVLAEMPYLHTDRSYYYPGETMWFSAHMQYYSPPMRDSLSRVLYTDLVGPSGKIVMTRIFPLSRDGGSGQLELPRTLAKGNYQLRAYTRWMLNFDKQFVFVKPIRILNEQEWVHYPKTEPPVDTANVVVETDRDDYRTRDKITVTLRVTPSELRVATGLSVSVTDLDQAVPATNETTILYAHMPDVVMPDTLERKTMYPIQYGIDIKGRFTTNRGKAEEGLLIFTQKASKDVFTVKTDALGNFYVPDLLLYDTAKISVHPKTAGGGRGGKVVIDTLVVSAPPTSFDTLGIDAYRETATRLRDRVMNKQTRVLKEVVVTSTRIADIAPTRLGFADVSVDGEFFRTTGLTDILMALQSRVPGLHIIVFLGADSYPKKYIVFSGTSTLQGSPEAKEPVVLIDGLVINAGDGGTADRISQLNPNEIDRVEVTKFGNGAAYGARGGNGVIAIYTRNTYKIKGKTRAPLYKEEKLVTLNIQGYASPRNFVAPDHSVGGDVQGVPDYRATLSWKPLVVMDEHNQATITFFAADLPTRYRIVAEGFTAEGVPVRGEKIITVQDR
ncbi:MAG TPA: carboxypeptidase-like regulatory domain-containing protein [Chryseolinea sp.]